LLSHGKQRRNGGEERITLTLGKRKKSNGRRKWYEREGRSCGGAVFI